MSTVHQNLADGIHHGRVKWLVFAGILSIVYYLAGFALLQSLDKRDEPFKQGASYSGTDSYEHKMNRVFFVIGLGGAVVTTGLYLAAPAEVRSPASYTLLVMWVTALAFVSIFSLDMLAAVRNTPNTVYDFVGKNSLCLAATAGFMTNRRKVTWHRCIPIYKLGVDDGDL